MDAFGIIGYIGYVTGAIILLTSKTKSENLSDLKDRVEILEKELKYSKQEHLDNQKSIKFLEGQLSTYKEVPLKRIARSLTLLSKSNVEILKTLQGSAIIAATDRDTLLNPKQNVKEQHVETQVVDKVTKK